MYQISSKLVHVFGLQMSITAECSIRSKRPLPWQPNHDGHVGDMIGCDRPCFIQIGLFIDRRVIAFPTFCNMAAICHPEVEFWYSGPPMKSTMRFDYHVKMWYRSDVPRQRYCSFIILPVWLENAKPRPLFRGFWGFKLLQLWVVIQTPKGTSLGDDTSFKP